MSIGKQASEKDGIGGYLTGAITTLAGRVLEFGTAAVEGKNLMTTHQPGTVGLLDEMRSTNVVVHDVQAGIDALSATAGAVSLMYLSANGAVGAAKRVAGYFNKAVNGSSPGYRLRKFFRTRGYTAIEATAIIQTMEEQGVTRLSIRDFGEKAMARQRAVSLGFEQKPISVEKKSRQNAIAVANGKKYVSDADIMHLEINGRNATPAEVEAFTARAHQRYSQQWTETGKFNPFIEGSIAQRPNPPFHHGAHLNLAHTFGDVVDGHRITTRYIRDKAGHPGTSITIRQTGNGNIIACQTPKWWTQSKIDEYEEILKNKQVSQGVEPVGWPTGGGKDWHQWWYRRYLPHLAEPQD